LFSSPTCHATRPLSGNRQHGVVWERWPARPVIAVENPTWSDSHEVVADEYDVPVDEPEDAVRIATRVAA